MFSAVTFLFSAYYLLRSHIDLVYERGKVYGGFGTLAAWLFHVRSIYEINEPYFDIPALLGTTSARSLFTRTATIWHHFVVEKATLVTVTSTTLITKGVAPKEKTLVIHTGVDTRSFLPRKETALRRKYGLEKKFVVLYNGSFSLWHACDVILKTAHEITKMDTAVSFVLVGEGPEYERCKQLAEQLQLGNRVLFTGKVSHHDVERYVAAADACLAIFDRTYPPFKKYSFFYYPVKLNEYKSCGKPIIASDFGNLKRLIVPKRNGLLVNEQDIRSVMRAIFTLQKDKVLCKRIADYNRKEAVQRYDWVIVNESILSAAMAKR